MITFEEYKSGYTLFSFDLNPDNYDEKYFKFVSELSILLDNMKLANVRKKISNYFHLFL